MKFRLGAPSALASRPFRSPIVRTIAAMFALLSFADAAPQEGAPLVIHGVRSVAGEAGTAFDTPEADAAEQIEVGVPCVSPDSPVPFTDPEIHAPAGAESSTSALGSSCPPTNAPLVTTRNFLAQQQAPLPVSGILVSPPDTMGSVGPNHVASMANDFVVTRDRQGNLLDSRTLNAWWSPVLTAGNERVFAPRLAFDRNRQRWYAAAVVNRLGKVGTQSKLVVAISTSSSPVPGAGAWTFFTIWQQTTNGSPDDVLRADFPALGFNLTWLAVSANMFDAGTFALVGSRLFAFDLATAVAGGPLVGRDFGVGFATEPSFNNDPGFTIHPCITFDPVANTLFLVDVAEWVDPAGVPLIRLSQITGTATNPQWRPIPGSTFPGGAGDAPINGSSGAFVAPTPFGFSGAMLTVPQCNSPVYPRIANFDATRINSAPVFRNGRIWATHCGAFPVAGPTDRVSVLWYELDPTAMPNPVVQSGVVDGGSQVFDLMPSISVNCADDAAIGFSRMGAGICPEAVYTHRLGQDAPGSMRNVEVIRAGDGPFTQGAQGPPGASTAFWGNYSATTVDPLDDRSFWTVQESSRVTNPGAVSRWTMQWAFIATNCDGDALANFEETSSPDCDGNGIPDECDPDCDANLIIDACEIAGNPALDCDGNGILDACDLVSANFRTAQPLERTRMPIAMATGDFDASGTDDVVYVNAGVLGEAPNVWIGVKQGSAFLPIGSWDFGPTPHQVAVADYDGVLGPDLAVVSDLGIVVRLNLGLSPAGVWLGLGPQFVFPGPGPACAVELRPLIAADFDNDGDPDLASASGYSGMVLRNDGPAPSGAPAFTQFPTLGGDQCWARILLASGDVNGDGLLDIVAYDSANGRLRFLLNLGGNMFDTNPPCTVLPCPGLALGADVWGLAVADLDRDGDQDVAMAGNALGVGGMYIARNAGGGSFVSELPISVPDFASGIVARDFDNDGNMDLAVSRSTATMPLVFTGSVLVLWNGTTGFATQSSFPVDPPAGGAGTPLLPDLLVSGDFDADCHADLAVAETFTGFSTFLINRTDPRWADLDMSGVLDKCELVTQPLCFGDGTQPTACPCGNVGAPGHGCANSVQPQGGLFTVSGTVNPDTVLLTASDLPAAALTIFLKTDAFDPNGAVYGDGVRCFAGTVVRLGTVTASGGVATFPQAGGPLVSVRGGTPVCSGVSGYYQAYYRNASVTFCTSDTFNITNAHRIVWE